MKKTLTIYLAIVMIIAMSVSVFAAPGSFDGSPSGKPGPELVEGDNETEACNAEIIVTAYGNRDQLSSEERVDIENAYSSIVGTQSVTSLNGKIEGIANTKGVAPAALAVSDLFNVSSTECALHDDHGRFKIVLSAETLKNYVCLLKYDNGAWVVVESAKLTNDGKYVEFVGDELGAYAIVVSTENAPQQPQKAGFPWWILIVIAVVTITVIVAVYLKKKADKAETNPTEGE